MNRIVQAALFGAVGSAIAETTFQLIRFRSVNPVDVTKAALVGAIVASSNRVTVTTLRNTLGLPSYEDSND